MPELSNYDQPEKPQQKSVIHEIIRDLGRALVCVYLIGGGIALWTGWAKLDLKQLEAMVGILMFYVGLLWIIAGFNDD